MKKKRVITEFAPVAYEKKRLALFSHKKGLKQLKVPIINMGVQKYLDFEK